MDAGNGLSWKDMTIIANAMPVYSTSYSFPYLLLLLYYVVLMFLEFRNIKFGKDTKYIEWAAIIGFVFFFGLRGFVNTDWLIYYNMFNSLPTLWGGDLGAVFTTDFTEDFVTDASIDQAGIELGFIFGSVFIKSIIPDYYVWVFINTVIDVILLHLFFKRYSSYYTLSFIFFLVFGGLAIELNLMRNIKALLLFLLSIKYIQERRLLPYLLMNGAGLLFHSSALLFLPLYFFLQREWPKWLIWTIFIVGNILFLLQIPYLKPLILSVSDVLGGRFAVKAKLYLASDLYAKSVGVGLGYFERVGTFLLADSYCQKRTKSGQRHFCQFVYPILYNLFFLFGNQDCH